MTISIIVNRPRLRQSRVIRTQTDTLRQPVSVVCVLEALRLAHVLGAMLQRDDCVRNSVWQLPAGKPHFAPKAKAVIWLFTNGGVWHVESFDPKPMLTATLER